MWLWRRCLTSRVDHHQSFNTAVATFHAYGKGIQSEQSRYSELADALIKAKQDLSTSKPEVKNMLENSVKYDKMLQTINQMLVVLSPSATVFGSNYGVEKNCKAYRRNWKRRLRRRGS